MKLLWSIVNLMHLIQQLKKIFGIKLQMFGEFNQCRPAEENCYDYSNNQMFREMNDFKLLMMQYKLVFRFESENLKIFNKQQDGNFENENLSQNKLEESDRIDLSLRCHIIMTNKRKDMINMIIVEKYFNQYFKEINVTFVIQMLFISLLIIFSWHPSDQAIDCKLSILKYPHRQKSQGLISGVLGGHQFQFIKWLPNLDVSHYFLNPIVNGSKGYTDQFHNSSCSLKQNHLKNEDFLEQQNQGDEYDRKESQEKFNDQQIIIPALFQNKQKSCMEKDQQKNTISQNIENILFSSNSIKTSSNLQSPRIIQDQDICQDNLNKNIFQSINDRQMNQQKELNCAPQNTSLKNLSSTQKKNNLFIYQFNNNNIEKEKEHEQLNFIESLYNIQDTNSSKKMQKNIQKIKKQMLDMKGFQLQKVEYQIRKDTNIFNFIKDIILLKKAVMMLLTKDQLAALQLVGCSSSFLELNLSSANPNLDQFCKIFIFQINIINLTMNLEISQNLSHYEMQLAILQQEKFLNYYVQHFLRRCSQTGIKNEVDMKILQSIQKCHQ
ncbi:hypothetical protein ABPG73_023048 [Tetrahymena malaccensis]